MTYTRDDFTAEQWDALCWCRLTHHYLWWQLMRELCGYRTGSPINKHMEQIVDTWLAQHPSWRGRSIDTNDVQRVIRGEA